MNIKFQETGIDGCWLVELELKSDLRGRFVKNFRRDLFMERGLEANFVEDFYSVSNKNVLRGMHFQSPPHHHTKLVSCIYGNVYDVIYDLRETSPTYLKHASFRLCEDKPLLLYIAPGVAHGFYTLSEKAMVTYKTSTYHSPKNDMGFLWSSAGIAWPGRSPIISERDSKFPDIDNIGTFEW